jgi:hypothetical protein
VNLHSSYQEHAMLKPARISRTAASDRLIKLWTDRYVPDIPAIAAGKSSNLIAGLIEAASESGRKKTVDRVRRMMKLYCEMAGLETNALFSYIPNIVNLAETRYLSQIVFKIYSKVLDVYASQPPPSRYLTFMDSSNDLFAKLALPSLMLPAITRLADELTPYLIELQEHHSLTRDSRTIGFLTTQFHFSTRELLKQLNTSELILLTPYLKFVEEQVCIPWQRICAAAARHLSSAMPYRTVEQLLPQCQAIANTTYERSAKQCQEHRSRRGSLTNPDIRTSTLRDLCMIQGYLLLCVLEGEMAVVEHELLPLCVMVFPSIDVKWELVETMLGLLIDELLARVTPAQRRLLTPYTQALQDFFAIPEMCLCEV